MIGSCGPPPKEFNMPSGTHGWVRRKIKIQKFVRAQGRVCPHCLEFISARRKGEQRATFEHVVPASKGGVDGGNLIASHNICNQSKRDNDPTPLELEMLDMVNKELGWNGLTYENTGAGQKIMKNLTWIVHNMPELVDRFDETFKIKVATHFGLGHEAG